MVKNWDGHLEAGLAGGGGVGRGFFLFHFSPRY